MRTVSFDDGSPQNEVPISFETLQIPYLATNNTHKERISMQLMGLEPVIPGTERPQTHALERATTGIGHVGL